MGIGVALRVEEFEGSRHVQMLLLFRIADDDMLINIFTQHFLVPPLRLELFQFQRQLCFPYKESVGMFFLSNNKPFHLTVCHTEEAIKTSAITTRATKFIAMLRPLHFNTKIHTCALNIFFVGKDMLQSRFERNFLESGNLICQG